MSDLIPDFLQQVFAKDPSIVARNIAGEMILVPIRQNMGDLDSIYLLNNTALFAWELLDGHLTLADIRDQITQEFEVDERAAGEDLLELINDLINIGAVTKA